MSPMTSRTSAFGTRPSTASPTSRRTATSTTGRRPFAGSLSIADAGGLVVSATADGQFPLYENSHGFKAPVSIRYSVGPSLPLGSTGLSLQYAGQYQSIGRWDGEQDEGTGFHNGGVFLRASFLPWKKWRVSPGVYREIYSKSLSDESFRQGTTYSLTVTRFF